MKFMLQYPYINLSYLSVANTFSLHRAYVVFRDLGLRHLVVVDEYNEVQGIVTRKDLLGFAVCFLIFYTCTNFKSQF